MGNSNWDRESNVEARKRLISEVKVLEEALRRKNRKNLNCLPGSAADGPGRRRVFHWKCKPTNAVELVKRICHCRCGGHQTYFADALCAIRSLWVFILDQYQFYFWHMLRSQQSLRIYGEGLRETVLNSELFSQRIPKTHMN